MGNAVSSIASIPTTAGGILGTSIFRKYEYKHNTTLQPLVMVNYNCIPFGEIFTKAAGTNVGLKIISSLSHRISDFLNKRRAGVDAAGRFSLDQFKLILPKASENPNAGVLRIAPTDNDSIGHFAVTDDIAFGEQRLSGLHPLSISKASWTAVCSKYWTAPKEAAEDIAAICSANPKDSSCLVAEGRGGVVREPSATTAPTLRFFECDWSLHFDPSSAQIDDDKFGYACRALFVVSSEPAAGDEADEDPTDKDFKGASGCKSKLIPVAIMVGGRLVKRPAADAGHKEVCVEEWCLAKLFAQLADVQVHEMRSHLFAAHFYQESFAVACGIHLPPKHRIGDLLRAHFKNLMFNNNLGVLFLIQKDGPVDRILSVDLDASIDMLVKDAWHTYHFIDDSFPNDLEKRGVRGGVAGELDGLDYPYRDDGLLVWQALGEYLQALVADVYPSDEALKEDAALMAFWDDLATPTRAFGRETLPITGLRGVPGSRVTDRSRALLVEILQRIVFRAGPYHASINYSQLDYLTYVPNQPALSVVPFPGAVNRDQAEPLLSAPREPLGATAAVETHLPNVDLSLQTVSTVALLTNMHYDKLGHYEDGRLDAFAQQSGLHAALDLVEKKINKRNITRQQFSQPYPFLLPSQIPNSTSI